MKMRLAKLMFVALVGTGLLLSGGCRSKKPGSGSGDDTLNGVSGTDIFGNPLGGRPGDGTSYQEGLFPPVYFGYDSSNVEASERGVLEQVAGHLQQNTSAGVLIEGHCDERGSTEYNLALGERRALAVRDYLISLGIDGGRIQTKSLGEEMPAAQGSDESAWAQNRRAEFLFF